jgi:hypothetical protein
MGLYNVDSIICEKINATILAERRKFDYTWSAKHAAVAYEKYHCCLKN